MHTSSMQRAYEAVKSRIVAGSLQSGDRIIVEGVCEEVHVSRTPVREALLALEREGLVRIIPRHGYFVTEISYREALDAYQLRFILEPIATAMAAQRINDKEIAHLRTLADVATDGSEESIIEAMERNRAFHVSISETTGNERLAQIMADLLDDMKRLTYVELRTERTEADWREEHEAIVEALERRDPMLAARVVRASFQHDAGLLPLRAKAELAKLLEDMEGLGSFSHGSAAGSAGN